jgi:hypothetical protein
VTTCYVICEGSYRKSSLRQYPELDGAPLALRQHLR